MKTPPVIINNSVQVPRFGCKIPKVVNALLQQSGMETSALLIPAITEESGAKSSNHVNALEGKCG